jgi:hypothetical protein
MDDIKYISTLENKEVFIKFLDEVYETIVGSCGTFLFNMAENENEKEIFSKTFPKWFPQISEKPSSSSKDATSSGSDELMTAVNTLKDSLEKIESMRRP